MGVFGLVVRAWERRAPGLVPSNPTGGPSGQARKACLEGARPRQEGTWPLSNCDATAYTIRHLLTIIRVMYRSRKGRKEKENLRFQGGGALTGQEATRSAAAAGHIDACRCVCATTPLDQSDRPRRPATAPRKGSGHGVITRGPSSDHGAAEGEAPHLRSAGGARASPIPFLQPRGGRVLFKWGCSAVT